MAKVLATLPAFTDPNIVMRFSKYIFLTFSFVLGVIASIGLAQDKKQLVVPSSVTQTEEEKLTIKDIMKEAHDAKTGLAKKVATGKATATEKARLQSLYEELAKLTPPKGDAKDWAAKTEKLVEAAKLAVANDPTAPKKLRSATNCKSCHKDHK